MTDTQPIAGLDDVLSQVKTAIRYAQRQEEAGELAVTFSSIDLTVEVVAEVEAGVGLQLKLPFLGEAGAKGKLTLDDTQTVSISLVPPPPLPPREGADFAPPPDIRGTLGQGIMAVRDVMTAAANDEPRFVLDKASVELKFVLTAQGSIELVLASGGMKGEITHSVKLGLSRPA